MKRYIASDLHNGNRVTDYERLIAFLDLVKDDADEFLILGDFDELLWSNMSILTSVTPYRYVHDKVREIARAKPTRICPGNHDWNLGMFASQLEPARIVAPFSEDGVYYTHGHEFDWLAIITGTPIDPIWWSVAFPFVFPTQFPLWLATKVWLGDEDKYSWGVQLINYFAAKATRARGCDTVLLGHTHFPQDTMENGVRIVNVGDQIDSRSYAIEENSIIELHYYE